MADTRTMVDEIESAYRRYIDIFNREDAAGFVSCYAHPHTMLSGEQGLLMVNTAAEHELGYRALMDTLHKQEWARSAIDHMQIWPFSDSLAQLVADVTRYRGNGSILEKIRASVMLRRDAGAWKIIVLSLIAQPFAGPGLPRPV